MSDLGISRRTVLGMGAGLVGAAAGGTSALAQAKTKPIKVASIYTVPVEQQWVSAASTRRSTPRRSAATSTYIWSENVANNDYERIMRQYAEEGTDLIVGEIFGVETRRRAGRRRAIRRSAFLMGSSFGRRRSRTSSVFDNFIHEPSYLTGMIAGAMTKSNTIGMVGGYAIPEVNRLMNAFMAGARVGNPDAKFQVAFIGSWFDPPKAKETAFAMIDAGADLMYAERFGVSDAAKERNVLAIGNVIDTSGRYPGTVVAWRSGTSSRRSTAPSRRSRPASFKAADYGVYSFMKPGGCSPRRSDLREARCRPRRGQGRRAKEKAIKDGSFTVEVERRRAEGELIGRSSAERGSACRHGLRSSFGSPASPSASARSSPMTPSRSTCGAARSWRCSARTAPARPR